jgi:hypothetical protein
MQANDEGRLAITLRDALIGVQAAARQRNAPRVLEALAECGRTAHQLFAQDSIALIDFQNCLAEIERQLRSGALDQAFQMAERQRQQIESLILAYAATGNLPEYVAEFPQMAARMTALDYHVGHLCEATYADRGSPTRTLMIGMLQVLEYALAGDLGDEHSARSLLHGKAAQSQAAAGEVSDCARLVETFIDEGTWAEIERLARRDGVPRLVAFTTSLVGTEERVHPRPAGPLVRGHYATVANFVFTIGLLIRHGWPQLAQELVAERRGDKAGR